MNNSLKESLQAYNDRIVEIFEEKYPKRDWEISTVNAWHVLFVDVVISCKVGRVFKTKVKKKYRISYENHCKYIDQSRSGRLHRDRDGYGDFSTANYKYIYIDETPLVDTGEKCPDLIIIDLVTNYGDKILKALPKAIEGSIAWEKRELEKANQRYKKQQKKQNEEDNKQANKIRKMLEATGLPRKVQWGERDPNIKRYEEVSE